MKKLIVLLLALAMVGAVSAQAAAPAPALTFNGYLNTGMEYDSTTGFAYLWNADTGNNTRVRLNAVYTNGNFGLNFRLQNSDVGGSMSGQLFGQALVWGNLFNNMVTYKAGRLNDYTWATSWNAWGNFDGQTGFQVQVKPVKGLNLGFFVPLAATKTVLATDALKAANVAAKYTADGVGSFLAHLDLGTTTNALILGANITAVKDLTAWFEARATDLTAIGTTTKIVEYLSYAMGDLAVGVYADQVLGATLGWTVAPEVSYVLGGNEYGLSVTFDDTGYFGVDPYALVVLGPKAKAKVYATIDTAIKAGVNFLYSF